VGVLQSEAQRGVVGVIKVGIGLALEGGDLSGYVCDVASEVLGAISVVSGAEIALS
jgi:hypothetical protein